MVCACSDKIGRFLPAGGSGEELTLHRPIVTYALIIINVAIYAITSYENGFLSIGSEYLWKYGFIPSFSSTEDLYRILTSMFLHADILHIFFNMYFLYIFGRGVEGVIGSVRFLALYLLSGIAATMLHTATVLLQGYDTGLLPLSIPAIGASGAISGVLGAYMMLYPGSYLSMCFFIFFFPLCGTFRTSTFTIFWFAMQVIYGYMRLGGIAFFAHAGGFIGGVALIWMLASSVIARVKSVYGSFTLPRYIVFRELMYEGLGGFAKAVLSILIISSVVAGVISYSLSANFEGYNIYSTEVFSVVSIENAELNNWGSFTLMISQEGPQYTFSMIIDPYTRILINRLHGAGLLKINDPETRELKTYIDEVIAIPGIQGVRVPVTINISARYNEHGVLIYAEGSLTTQIIYITREGAVPGEYISYSYFTLNARGPSTVREIVSLPVAVSSLVGLLALYVVVGRDRDLALT